MGTCRRPKRHQVKGVDEACNVNTVKKEGAILICKTPANGKTDCVPPKAGAEGNLCLAKCENRENIAGECNLVAKCAKSDVAGATKCIATQERRRRRFKQKS